MNDITNHVDIASKLTEQCDRATVEQFKNKLEVSTIIYAYVEKRFKERFPNEYEEYQKELESK